MMSGWTAPVRMKSSACGRRANPFRERRRWRIEKIFGRRACTKRESGVAVARDSEVKINDEITLIAKET